VLAPDPARCPTAHWLLGIADHMDRMCGPWCHSDAWNHSYILIVSNQFDVSSSGTSAASHRCREHAVPADRSERWARGVHLVFGAAFMRS
jgi:hypothetical protein